VADQPGTDRDLAEHQEHHRHRHHHGTPAPGLGRERQKDRLGRHDQGHHGARAEPVEQVAHGDLRERRDREHDRDQKADHGDPVADLAQARLKKRTGIRQSIFAQQESSDRPVTAVREALLHQAADGRVVRRDL
jgi:hypothetical protein